jgi:CubicO group peptidase (beta-lactamase class C family)
VKSQIARFSILTSKVLLIVGIFLTCTSCLASGTRYEYVRPVATEDGWPTATLIDVGIDETPIVQLMNGLNRRRDHLIHGLLVIKDGSLVLEEYFDGGEVDMFRSDLVQDSRVSLTDMQFNRDELHNCASVSKSVTEQLLGIAVEKGYVAGTDAPLLSFFPDHADRRSPEKERITIQHLLTMTSGLPFDEETYPLGDPRNDASQLFLSDDPVAFMLRRDVVHPPGTVYQYSSGNTVLLGEIIRRTTRQSIPAFAAESLFEPLQISSFRWAPMPEAPEITYTPGGLYLRPRDMAKIGQLMLQEGVWNGNRVLSSDWVRRSVSPAISMSGKGDADGYGYCWKLGRFGGVDAYWAAGWGGQYVVVMPDLRLVYVQTGGRYNSERIPISYREIIEDFLLPAISEYRSPSESVDLSGDWTGYVIMGDGARADIRLRLTQDRRGYAGAIRGNGSAIPRMELRDIVFDSGRLSFEVDFPSARGTELITFNLRYWKDTLDGSYTDPTGDSDKVIVRRER